jgi:hypothetical protein
MAHNFDTVVVALSVVLTLSLSASIFAVFRI